MREAIGAMPLSARVASRLSDDGQTGSSPHQLAEELDWKGVLRRWSYIFPKGVLGRPGVSGLSRWGWGSAKPLPSGT